MQARCTLENQPEPLSGRQPAAPDSIGQVLQRVDGGDSRHGSQTYKSDQSAQSVTAAAWRRMRISASIIYPSQRSARLIFTFAIVSSRVTGASPCLTAHPRKMRSMLWLACRSQSYRLATSRSTEIAPAAATETTAFSRQFKAAHDFALKLGTGKRPTPALEKALPR